MSFSIGSLTRLPLGMQGESNSRPIRIDVHEWLEDWPGAAVNLMVCRPGEEEYYPAQSKVENGILTWVPSRSDVLIAGKGIAQFILTDENDVELRSRVVETLIGQSIRGTEGEAPEPVEGWVHEVLQAANGIKVSADRAEEQAQTAWQYSANAATSAENAEKAKQAAINNADDAEAAASNAQTWAGRAEAFAGNAATSAGNAEAAAATSTQSAASAAGSEARAEEIVQEMTGGVGGLYIVSVSGGKSNRTQAEIFAAVNAGKTCIMVSTAGEVKTYYGRDNGRPAFVSYSPDASGIAERRKYVEADGSVTGKTFAPARTPNPAQLIFSGAVEAEYDGSGLVRVHIPAGGSGSGGGVPDPGTAYQQFVSDASGRAVWQPLTHYTETIDAVVLENTALTVVDGTAYLTTPPAAEPTVGGKYNVTWNGTAYTCDGVAYDMEGVPCVYMGNMSGIGGEDTGEPFAVMFLPADAAAAMGAYAIAVPMDGATEITLSVNGRSEVVHKIDDKYLNSRNNNLENGNGANSLRQRTAAAEGDGYTLGESAVATGRATRASEVAAHAEGDTTTASGIAAHAEGCETNAEARCAHAEGDKTTASGNCSHAEGRRTTASGNISHAEGSGTTASGNISHAEGSGTTASGEYAHAEGLDTEASGSNSHAEGSSTIASGSCSHAEGWHTIAASPCQHVQGRWNVEDAEHKLLHIVGNGTGEENRRNVHTVDISGNAWYAGDVYVGGDGQGTGERLVKASELGGEYELIETITTEEDVTSISRSATPDGQPYKFRAAIVTVHKPSGTSKYILQAYTYHENGKNTRIVLDFSSDGAMGARMEVYPHYGYYKADGYLPSTAYSNSSTALSMANANVCNIPEDGYIKSIALLAYSTGVIPAGSEIKIWGVRANV